MLGDIHLMVESNIGGDDGVLISPWRHLREKGSIALDMGVHYTDIFAYLLGDLERACGMSFIAEPGRVLGPGMVAGGEVEELSPGVMRATGDDSLVGIFETAVRGADPAHLPAVGTWPAVDPAQPARAQRFDERAVRSHGRAGRRWRWGSAC